MINLVKNIIKENSNDFTSDDAILFITMEDPIQKLVRRFISIFGNIDASMVKLLYQKSYESLKANQLYSEIDNNLINKVTSLFQGVLNASIAKQTKGKVNLIVKYASEGTFSAGDVSKFIDRLKIEGYNTKMVILDYLDCMAPIVSKNQKSGDYDIQGQITQELRYLAAQYKVPIITATQNTRGSDNVNVALSNNMAGDSYKKIRYSDFVYMCRQDSTKDPFDPAVRQFVIDDEYKIGKDQLSPDILRLKDQICSDVIPLEVKITKSKDGGKDQSRYLLFCKKNLRIYNTIGEYIRDMKPLLNSSKKLEGDIGKLSAFAVSSVSFNPDEQMDMLLDQVVQIDTPIDPDTVFQEAPNFDIPAFLSH